MGLCRAAAPGADRRRLRINVEVVVQSGYDAAVGIERHRIRQIKGARGHESGAGVDDRAKGGVAECNVAWCGGNFKGRRAGD